MDRRLVYLFTLLLIICRPDLTCGQNIRDYKFNRIEVEKGLSNSEVRCIYKDRTGFMWFGTPFGLNRYDGYELITYKQDLSQEHKETANNDIYHIQESYDGKLWLFTPSGYTIYDVKHERFEEDATALFGQYSGVSEFWRMYIDLGKNFWFVTWQDVRLYDVKKGKRTVFEQGAPGSLSRGLLSDIRQGENRYWFLFDNGLLECMDAQTQKVISRDSTLKKMIGKKNLVDMRLFIDSSGDVWVYNIDSEFGIACYSVSKNSWQVYSNASPAPYYISNDIVFGMEEDEKGNIWVGTDHGGVTLINKRERTTEVLWHDDHDPTSLSQNTIRCIYRDDKGIMWLGTYKKGICYYHESIYKFKAVTDRTDMPYSDVNCFFESKEGNIWIGTNGGGLLYYDRKHDTYTVYKHIPGRANTPAGDVIVSLEADRSGRLWIGYYLAGMDCFDGKTFTHYTSHSSTNDILPDNNVWKLHCDRAGNLWIGTLNGGVVVMDVQTGQRIKWFDSVGPVYDITEKKSGEVMVGSRKGLYFYNTATDQLELYEKDVFEKARVSRYDISNLYEDSRGLLWVGTRNGLFVYNPYTRELRLFTAESGLSADLIQNVQEDAEHNMWVATNGGLTCIRVTTANETPGYFFHMVNYDRSDGLQGELFNFNAGYITSKSELIFGGLSGFNIFVPTRIIDDAVNPPVVLTDFQIYNESIRPGETYKGRVLLEKSISQTDEITLNYSDNYFTLSFAALDYCKPGKARYFYKLEGFNNQWLEADRNSRQVTYTNLNPGKYTFYVKAISNDANGQVYPVALQINIRPPFWQTRWAWAFYTLVVIGSFYGYRRRMVRKAEKKLAYTREKLRITQQHEMDEMKLRFFTNISHEFRTPLTLILTPLEDMIKKISDPEKQQSLRMIRRNALQLLRLVNQLLDFRKMDVQGHTLQKSVGDIVQFVREQTGLFAEASERKQIELRFSTDLSPLYVWFDADKLSKVLVNVLSNAYKFTPTGGCVTVELARTDEGKIRISVTDTGIGIPEEALDKIFERFYQVKHADTMNYQGSGIGLHLAKEFVKLHGGEMWAERMPEGGSRFVVLLPCMQEETNALPSEKQNVLSEEESEVASPNGSPETASESDELPKLLLVDDNDDFRLFLSGKLSDQYTVLQAADGVEGLEMAYREIPDMILSDVMMPRLDGINMSKQIKADIRTSHIPLILLTAKSGEESKLEGLTAGADDYITKPFNLEILLVKIHNLVEARKRNREIFQDQIRIEPSKIAVSSLDEKLIRKALEYTETNISNPDFSVEELSRELGMSRVHLYKKLSSLTGKTPIEFIRVIRLKRAAQLLEESQLTVSEIAYEVGFNNPKYFRKYFKDEFGVLPSQYGTRNE